MLQIYAFSINTHSHFDVFLPSLITILSRKGTNPHRLISTINVHLQGDAKRRFSEDFHSDLNNGDCRMDKSIDTQERWFASHDAALNSSAAILSVNASGYSHKLNLAPYDSNLL